MQVELLSRHAEEGLADHPPDHLLAATRDELYNALVCTRLAPEVGRERVYQLAPSADHLLHMDTGISRDARGKVLGDGDLDFDALAGRHEAGWGFVVAGADEDHAEGDLSLLSIGADGTLDIFSADHETKVAADGSRLLVFRPAAPNSSSAALDNIRPVLI